jgi:hypothetical protein
MGDLVDGKVETDAEAELKLFLPMIVFICCKTSLLLSARTLTGLMKSQKPFCSLWKAFGYQPLVLDLQTIDAIL